MTQRETGSAEVGNLRSLSEDEREWDIPVIFQATGTEDEAAEKVAYAIGHASLVSPDNGIESWHMPNHQFADGSDAPVRVEIERIEPAYSERLGTNSIYPRVAGQNRYHVDFEDDNGLQYSMDAFLTPVEASDVIEELEERDDLHEVHVFKPMELAGKDALMKHINESFEPPEQDTEDDDDEDA